MASSPAQAVPPSSSVPAGSAPHPIKGLRWYICGLLFFVTFINYADRVSLGGMAPLLKKEIGWDDAQFGWINFAFQLSYAIFFPIAGRFIDRVGVRTGLAVGVVLWSVAAMGHSLASTALGFAIARFILGIGEATNFPGCVKAVAEWFPKRERSFATGIFNTGTNFGAMLQGPIMALAVFSGWQAAFIFIGLLGFVWLVGWFKLYRSPEEHRRLSADELALIRSDQEPPAKTVNIPWPMLLRYRQAWAFALGKMFTDPVWWFYLTWLPSYLQRERQVSLASGASALLVIYLFADVGSILGGWMPGFFIKRGWSNSKARLTVMLLFALGLPISALAVMTKDLWSAVALISVATFCHQAWSANMFTVASDAFPKRAVGSVVGFGSMCGGIGGLFMSLISGGMLQWTGSYVPLFIFAGVMHPIAWFTIRALSGKEIKEVNLDTAIDSGFSPTLLSIGVVLMAAGVGLGVLVASNWDYILSITKNSSATAAAALAGAAIIAFLGAALSYASRAQKSSLT